MLKFLSNLWNLITPGNIQTSVLIKSYGFFIILHVLACTFFYLKVHWGVSRETILYKEPKFFIPKLTSRDIIKTFKENLKDQGLPKLADWFEQHEAYFKKTTSSTQTLKGKLKNQGLTELSDWFEQHKVYFKKTSYDFKSLLEKLPPKTIENINHYIDALNLKLCNSTMLVKYPITDRFLEFQRSHTLTFTNKIFSEFITLASTFWMIVAVLIVFFSGIVIIKNRVDSSSFIKKHHIDNLTSNFISLTIIIFMIVYSVLSFRILSYFEFWVNASWFLFRFENFSIELGFIPVKYVLVYVLTLIYPLITLIGLKNNKFISAVQTKQKFFIFYLLTFTFYVFFLYAVDAKNFIDLFIALEGQSFTFIVILAILRNRVNYSLLTSYILQIIICSGFILLGLTIFYYKFHTLTFVLINALNDNVVEEGKAWIYFGLFAFLFGVAGKSGGFPFFRWPFDLYTSIPIPLVFISSCINKVGILIPTFFILKCCFPLTLSSLNPIVLGIIAFSISGLIFASCYGLTVKTIRELLAASAISQTSYIFILILNPAVFGEIVIALYLVGYIFAVVIICIFILNDEAYKVEESKSTLKTSQEVIHYPTNNIQSEFFNGLIIWTIFVTFSGLPPSSFFISKFAFLANVYINILEVGGTFGILVIIVFVFANFLNMIIYAKFVFNNLNNNDSTSTVKFNTLHIYSKVYWPTLILINLLIVIILMKGNI